MAKTFMWASALSARTGNTVVIGRARWGHGETAVARSFTLTAMTATVKVWAVVSIAITVSMELIQVLETSTDEGVLLHTVKLLVTLTEEREMTSEESLQCLDAVERLLNDAFQDAHIAENACWVLANLTEVSEEVSRRILSQDGVFSPLLEILCQEVAVTPQTTLYAVTVLGRLLSVGTDTQVEALLKVDFLSAVKVMLHDKDSEVRSRAFECVSTLCQCGPVVIQSVIDNELLTVLLYLQTSTDQTLKDRASRALLYACRHANAAQVCHLIDIGVLLTLCKILQARGRDLQIELVSEALQSLHALLVCLLKSSAAEFEDVCAILSAAGAWDSVYRLRTNKDKMVRELAVELDENKIRMSVKK
eukprot:gene44380-55189_t